MPTVKWQSYILTQSCKSDTSLFGTDKKVRLVEMAAVLDEVGKSEEKLVNNRNVDDMDDIEGEDGASEASKKKKRKKKKKKAGKKW